MGTFRWRAAVVLGAGLLVGMGACKDDRLALSIDLRTDFLPGAEFTRVLTEVVADGSDPTSVERAVVKSDAGFVDGARVADFSNLKPGGFAVQVRVMTASGKLLVERNARLKASSDYALTMVVTRSCEGVVCPIPEGDPALTTCSGGQCVQPECLPENPESCPEPQCTKNADCDGSATCADAACILGSCFYVPRDSRCSAGQKCDAIDGCVGGPPAAGCQPKGATETGCSDGVDDDCDGEIDCEDSDCAARSCDDGSACTKNDVCVGITCLGTTDTCDDGNGCTDDSCDAKTGCQHTNNAAPCSDGVFCNGADTCQGGACAVHAGPPCAACDEGAKTCLACATSADCGPPAPGAWSACAGADCALEGTHSRQVTTPTCVNGSCSSVVTTETEACAHAPITTACKPAEVEPWPDSCDPNPGNECDTTGSRSRVKKTFHCEAGACQVTKETQKQDCAIAVKNGKACGPNNGKYCCGGSCVSKSSPNHCGACGISCGGNACKDIGAGFACGCSTDAQCISRGYGDNASCYMGSCNCRCKTASCCSGADCVIVDNGVNHCKY